MKTLARPLLVALAPLLACAAALVRADDEPAPRSAALLEDAFSAPLDEERWEPVRLFDTKTDRLVVDDGQLVLGLETLGTDDATVKLRGLRTRTGFEAAQDRPLRVSVTIDWSAQRNGCYLTAGVALLPEGADGAVPDDPRTAPEALVFEWVGVPPGTNVRPALWRRRAGGLRPLYTEGWPQPKREDRVGRAPKKTRTTLEVEPGRVKLLEDGVEKWSGDGGIGGRLRVLLFVTGHSNYPPRQVTMDDLRIER